MPLPSPVLRMQAIGIRDYSPPQDVPDAPFLKDGIHLRWAFARASGFPWHGFYLFRRKSERGKHLCSAESLATFQPGQLQTNILTTGIGRFESTRNLRLTDDFPDPGRVEIDLNNSLRCLLPEPARRVQIRLGLRDRTQTCISFRGETANFAAPIKREKAVFRTFDFRNRPDTLMRTIGINNVRGLNINARMEIDIDCPADLVTVSVINGAAPVNTLALNKRGDIVGKVQTTIQGQIEHVNLRGEGITRIVINAPSNEAALLQLCYRCIGDGGREEKRIPLVVTAFSAEVPVATTQITVADGPIANIELIADQIDSVTFSADDAALIELCYLPIDQNTRNRWNPVPDLKQPISLPVAHGDYPCPEAPASFNAARNLAENRVRYDLPAEWEAPDSFNQLHQQLRVLVNNGPAGGPMAERTQTIPVDDNADEPVQLSISDQFPLDTVLLGALQPALAQMIGLYWVDSTVEVDQAYDYLLIGDYDQRFSGRTKEVLSWIGINGFVGLEAAILFDKRIDQAPPLETPQNVRGYALPGGVFPDADGNLRDAQNAAGLRWRIRHTRHLGRVLLHPNQPIMYHAWRSSMGLPDPVAPAPANEHKRITARPLFVTDPNRPINPERPTDWPPFNLFAQDRGLEDGWYSYRVNGVDIFGRTSSLSQPARWFQWSPRPNPAPHYYQLPEGDRSVHPFAVQLLDKLPPPPPTGVEAQALDPEDAYLLRDAAYQTWFNSLSANEQENLVGLRVRWRWTLAQQRQAPDTAEFRIYYNPGSPAPTPDARNALNWQARHYVVNYEAHVDVAPDGTRTYQILLPTSADVIRNSLPLAPSLADPVVYANIGVTAVDDKLHTGDHVKWNGGNWGGRTGNEGAMSASATIYRVWRAKPTPPVPAPDADRVFATAADYHSRSFYTYRWRPSPHLKTHIFRALDDTVFQTDWTQRPYVVSAENEAIFPPELQGNEVGIVLRRDQVAAELNAINNFPDTTVGKRNALTHYRVLSNDSLRVLAGLPQTARAFSQLTTEPLDSTASDNDDRRGPDSPANYVPNPALRAFTDTLDGRATSRYFYRAAYVDSANNRSALSLASAPVYLPNVSPPQPPSITKALGDDRAVSLRWASNREPDLASYRVYRTTDAANSRDIRLMTLVETIVEAADVELRSAEIIWADTPLLGLTTYYYRITAVDDADNESQSSIMVQARATDTALPTPPALEVSWQPRGSTHRAAISWTSDHETLIQRREVGVPTWTDLAQWREAGAHTIHDPFSDSTRAIEYRAWSRKYTGAILRGDAVLLDPR
ncbi:MAG: fibronectin type III domain-containing protein [Candidatus Promineifilaceae bacterium]